MTYNPWPIGGVPEELRRHEPEFIKDHLGYKFNDAREIIDIFERKLAAFAGSRYAVAVDCCTHAMELAFRLQMDKVELMQGDPITMPEHTYISAYFMLLGLGLKVKMENFAWSGIYNFRGSRVFDGAVRWKQNMFVGDDALQCLSFQIKKRIPIGRGGCILLNDEEEYKWLKRASYDGRDLNTPYDSPGHVGFAGKHYYMTPEDAARGIILMDAIKTEGDSATDKNYPSIIQMLSHL